MDDEVIIGIIIIIVLAIFIVAVIIGFYLSDQTTNLSGLVATQTGLFLSACTTTSCSSGFVCDGNTFVCRLPAGALCNDATDCVTGLICSGLCATGATGGLNQLCPCNPGFLCTVQNNRLTICKGAGGTSCQLDSDCASDICLDNNTCAAGDPNSFPCTTNAQCASNNCNNGFCQTEGITTGTIGAACAGACVGFVGAVCNSTVTNPLVCECISGTGEPGTCVTVTQGILSSCSTLSACTEDLICLATIGQTGQTCGTGTTGCICVFPYIDPNSLATGGVCINGMSPIISLNKCFNNNGLGCDSGGMCVNQACGGSSVLATYLFQSRNVPNLRTDYTGATTTNIRAATSGPPGLISPHKLFATSSGDVDTIYLVDNLQGLMTIQYNPISMSIISPWTQLIPHQTITMINPTTTSVRNLIDVGYNGTSFLVAFDETVTGTGGSAQNDTVYIGPTPGLLSPFNFQPGSGLTGTQYTTTDVPLSILYIDISSPNDASVGNDVLISFNGTIHIKQSTQTKYSVGIIEGGPSNGMPMTGLTGPARFYFDNTENAGATGTPVCPSTGQDVPIRCASYQNVSFVGRFDSIGPTGTTGTLNQVLQYSGNIAGTAAPNDRFDGVQYAVYDYSIYSVPPGGMPRAGTVILAQASLGSTIIDNVVAATFGGSTTLFPYKVGMTSRSVATANAFYIISIGSCT